MTGNHGHPQEKRKEDQVGEQTEQTISLNTQQAGQQLGVDGRTIRRWITDGLRTSGGAILRLQARQVRNARGPEWQIYQTDLEAFKEERGQLATEGEAAGQLLRAEENQSQALATSIQIISTELERRSQALADAQATIERLAREAGREAGRSQELERERDVLRLRIQALEQEREQWKSPRRIRLLPWQ